MVLAAAIIQTRLTERLRAADGATYAPSVSAGASDVSPAYGFLMGMVDISPSKISLFDKEIAEIVRDLSLRPVAADELERARRPILDSNNRDRQGNVYWLTTLGKILRDPRYVDVTRDHMRKLQQITPAEIQSVVRRYCLKDQNEIVIIPTSATP